MLDMNDRPEDNRLPLAAEGGETTGEPVEDLEVVEEYVTLDERRRRRGATVAAASFLVILLAVVVVQSATSGGDDDGLPTGVAPDATSMEFEMLDGSLLSLAQLEGTPVVLNFFASWCAPCIREMPEFEEVHQELSGDVHFLGVNTRDTPDQLRRLLDDTGVTYDIGLDPRGDLVTAFGGTVMPTTVFVTAEGRIVAVHGGELDADGLRRMIDREFAG